MKAIKKCLIELVALVIVGVVLASGANTIRAKGSLQLNKNYFDKGVMRVQPESPPVAEVEGEEHSSKSVDQSTDRDEYPDHDYQEISFEEVVAVFEGPGIASGAHVFVDARNDDAYNKGHIPGAVQADHYQLEDYIDDLLSMVDGAEKIIVYCNGGDCEDSIYLCADLMEFDIEYDKVFLYAGGWKEWIGNNMAVATGSEAEGYEN